MSLLLDTHAFIWWMTAPERLSQVVYDRIIGNRESAFLSAVTAYEIEYKRARGASMPNFGGDLPALVSIMGFDWLPIEPEDGVEAARLNNAHRDPWDRILAAQAKRRNLEFVTADTAIHAANGAWNVRLLW